MIYETRPDGRILGSVVVEDIPIRFVAKEVHKLRGAVRAWIGVQVAGRNTFDRINADSDRERTHLANSAHKTLGLNAPFGPTAVKTALDDFTYGLWEQHLGQVKAEPVNGNRELRQKFIMRPYFMESAGVIAFAPPGTGKSFTGLCIAVTVDHGLADSPFGEPVGKFPVLYINLERSRDSMAARLADVNRALGLPEDRPLLMINARGKTLSDVFEQARDFIQKNGVKFVVLDSISRSGYGDLNDNQSMNLIMDSLNGLSVAWLAIAHTPRGDTTHAYGSVMADAAADVMLAVNGLKDRNTGKIVLELNVTKANDIRWPKKRYIAYEFDDDGLTTIREGTAAEYVALDTTVDVSEQLANLVDDVMTRTSKEWTAGALSEEIDKPRNKVSAALKDGERTGLYSSRKDGKEVLYKNVSQDVSPQDTFIENLGSGAARERVPLKGDTFHETACSRCGRQTDSPAMSNEGDTLCLACFEEEV